MNQSHPLLEAWEIMQWLKWHQEHIINGRRSRLDYPLFLSQIWKAKNPGNFSFTFAKNFKLLIFAELVSRQVNNFAVMNLQQDASPTASLPKEGLSFVLNRYLTFSSNSSHVKIVPRPSPLPKAMSLDRITTVVWRTNLETMIIQ